jgi:hypothetical protein
MEAWRASPARRPRCTQVVLVLALVCVCVCVCVCVAEGKQVIGVSKGGTSEMSNAVEEAIQHESRSENKLQYEDTYGSMRKHIVV